MSKKIIDSLKLSLKQERDISKTKFSETDLFAAADKLFSKNSITAATVNTDKVVRDTFTFPEKEYFLIEKTKNRLLENKLSATKSKILRMALVALDECSNDKLITCYESISKVKLGRPKYK